MSVPRQTTTTTSSRTRIPIKSSIPQLTASSSVKTPAVKPTIGAGTTPALGASLSRTKPTVSSTSTSTQKTRTTNTNNLPVPKSPASRNSKTPSPSKSRPTHLQTSQTRRPVSPSPAPSESKPPLSIREAIALKRAEAKKAQSSGTKTLNRPISIDEFSLPNQAQQVVVDEVELSRWSIRESIERARSSGSLNLSSRALHSIPSSLFEIHLGVTPEPLENAPKESDEVLLMGKAKERKDTAWFEVVDLTVLKLRDNAIIAIQPEISLFGSLKVLELRNNQLTSLPDSLTDLINLVTLDVSGNQLTSLPPNIATLPLLTTLDVSSNQLTSLSLSIMSSPVTSPTTTSFFSPVQIDRASRPLPSLKQLLASNNKIQAITLPTDDLPTEVNKIDLSYNPLGNGDTNAKAAKLFIHSLSKLPKLKQLILEATELNDRCFDFTPPSSTGQGSGNGVENNKLFRTLELLDLGKTKVTEKVQSISSGRPVSFEGEAIEGGVRVILGNRIQKEAWEIEAEKRTRKTNVNAAKFAEADLPPTPPKSPVSPTDVAGTHGNGQSLAHYYTSTSQTLSLPKALPPSHNRSRSLAATVSMNDRSDPTVPVQTLPLSLILVQPFANSLTCLILSNRRADPSFIVPEVFFTSLTESMNKDLEKETEPYFPHLQELRLDGCSLGDITNISTPTQKTKKEPLFNVINHLFPTLAILDLCDNRLTHVNGINALLIPSKSNSSLRHRSKGLKAVRLRGNKLADLSGLEDVANTLRKDGKVEGWSLEELDLRENEIARLPPILGFLSLDVMLVEGNIFRVPSRRVWEVDGTKGLLTWLKGRVE
ncbi:hypothetical protein Clacol_001386 [Clathrus columnatus]|uniref:Leucine-rich repeat-containing protein 40 n=1 Tax=Clathrus columnatus TaxID=1419009 RepID=A0AAV4ZY52_9AGAM|nr:hypothetical protein Clacol_001386 [Clathrus columnatus]